MLIESESLVDLASKLYDKGIALQDAAVSSTGIVDKATKMTKAVVYVECANYLASELGRLRLNGLVRLEKHGATCARDETEFKD